MTHRAPWIFALLLAASPSRALGQTAAVDVSGGGEAPPWAEDALPSQSDEHPPPSARTNLLLTGGAVTLGFYGMAFGTSYLWPSSPVADDLRIPVVGPYSAVFGAGCGDHERGCGTFVSVIRTTLAALGALGQTGGVLLLGEALFLDTEATTAVRGDGDADSAARGRAVTPRDPLFYAPVVDEHSLGLVVGGSF